MFARKEQSCQNNPKKSYTERKAKHEPSGYSLSLISSFDTAKSKHYFYRGKYCIEHFCKALKELETEIINYKEKEMIPLTDTQNKKPKNIIYAKKSFEQMNLNTKKSEIIVITLKNLEE